MGYDPEQLHTHHRGLSGMQTCLHIRSASGGRREVIIPSSHLTQVVSMDTAVCLMLSKTTSCGTPSMRAATSAGKINFDIQSRLP